MELNALYEHADNSGVIIECYDFTYSPSVSILDEDVCYIGINPFMLQSDAEEKVKLAHELGHCETGAFYNRYALCDIREKHERRADKWAIKKLVPKDELDSVIENGITDISEIADYFRVTEEFAYMAMWYYRYGNLSIEKLGA